MDISDYLDISFVPEKRDNIWQLTDSPDIVTDGSGDKYIGYEYIGESYSGNRRYIIEERDRLTAKVIAELTGDGVFLDLACGDGCLTVPCAALGTKIIAGDISNAMLKILREKARSNGISLEKTALCRMNALEIPLKNKCIDTEAANSVLHLISNPEKVINEIYRVLKVGGSFVCVDDAPGKNNENQFDNSLYNEIVSRFYSEYWSELDGYGIAPRKFSWSFDRHACCAKIFADFETRKISRGNTYKISLKDGFLPRFISRGFSDQVSVPQDIHHKTIDFLLEKFAGIYGSNFADIEFVGIEDDLLITVYKRGV